jgi:hypothetical protein
MKLWNDPAWIKQMCREASENAIKDSFARGLPVTVLKGDYLIRLYPDGSYDLLKKYERKFVKAEKREYKL